MCKNFMQSANFMIKNCNCTMALFSHAWLQASTSWIVPQAKLQGESQPLVWGLYMLEHSNTSLWISHCVVLANVKTALCIIACLHNVSGPALYHFVWQHH